jgi:hypothetical protein
MDKAKLTVLLLFVSVLHALGVNCNVCHDTKLWNMGREQSGLMGQGRKTENWLYETTGSRIEIK